MQKYVVTKLQLSGVATVSANSYKKKNSNEATRHKYNL